MSEALLGPQSTCFSTVLRTAPHWQPSLQLPCSQHQLLELSPGHLSLHMLFPLLRMPFPFYPSGKLLLTLLDPAQLPPFHPLLIY